VAYDLYTGAPDDEQAKIAYLLQLFQYARQQRVNFEVSWEESAAIVYPEYRNSWSFGHVRAPGVKYTQYQVDSTAAIANWRFMAIADAMVTPHNMLWSKVEFPDPYLMRQRDVRLYCEEVSRILWAERYRPSANFMTQQQTNWQCLGAFGNQGMLVDALDKRAGERPGLRYMAQSPGEV